MARARKKVNLASMEASQPTLPSFQNKYSHTIGSRELLKDALPATLISHLTESGLGPALKTMLTFWAQTLSILGTEPTKGT